MQGCKILSAQSMVHPVLKTLLRENKSLERLILRPHAWIEQPSIDTNSPEDYRRVNIQKFMVGRIGGLIIALWATLAVPVWAADQAAAQPAALFEVHCAGCHLNGGNIVRRGKTLKLKALQQNSADSIAAIATIVANGKNNMSAYRDKLTAPQIDALAHYVLDRATKGWAKA
jgi:cytochrome c6